MSVPTARFVSPGAPCVARAAPRGVAGRRGLALGLAALSCGGEVIELGAGDAAPRFGGQGDTVRNLNAAVSEEFDPTLTDDLLEIFFVSDRLGGVGNKDVWRAERRDRRDPFDPPTLVREVSSPSEEATAAISGDGLTLWVGSRREGGLGGVDVWRFGRSERSAPFGEPEHLAALSSPADDLPRPPGLHGDVLPVASDREGLLFQTYLAIRAGPHQEFEVLEPLRELWDDTSSMDDACLSDDGLHLFFRRAPVGQPGDLFVAWRRSIDEPFEEPPLRLDAINSADDDRDPFVSADRARFFFASNRADGVSLDIYAAPLYLPTFR